MAEKDKFTFEISLSVLNHLGRNLYRSFVTVIGEAISNSWDADAENVWIYIDKENNSFCIKDDGDGMTSEDFQNKFLKIGYSKRKDGSTKSTKKRPYIGRKGIGKLALLSCAEKIKIISKTKKTKYIGGIIDNSGLDNAIKNDFTPDKYSLSNIDLDEFGKLIRDHKKGTIILFENIKEGIKNSLDLLRRTIALYFRFSLIDKSFNIFVEDKKITLDDLNKLAEKTEFLWRINEISDPYIDDKLINLEFPTKFNIPVNGKRLSMKGNIKGFIASVKKYSDLNIFTAEERVSVDLFVNGRLREKDILKHIPTSRMVENYLYGQIHFDDLDIGDDKFTSSREGVIADDPIYKDFLIELKDKVISTIINDWDEWRVAIRKEGDSDNPRMTKKERKSKELYDIVSGEYSPPKSSNKKVKVDNWIDELSNDARFNLSSYAECFISENLIRKYILEKKIKLTKEALAEAQKWKKEEIRSKGVGNISIEIRRINSDLNYLSMAYLANLDDKKDPNKEACLARDANEYKPMRDAVAHTALLTNVAKGKLTSVYENIKGRVKTLLSK